jgi:co-chaperonin GroES (HSP10)
VIKPTGKRYIIEPEELKKETASGIILKSNSDTQFAIVKSAGPGVEDVLPVGTRVVVEWSRTIPLKDPEDNKQYFLIESNSVIAVVEEV